MKTRHWLFLSLTLLACCSAQAQQREVRFGVDPSFPPFEFKTPDGQLAGFDIDLGNAICSEMQVRCRWIENSFDGLIPALKAKKFDGILSSLSITKERSQAINFSDKLFNTPAFLVAGKNSGLKPTAESLKGKHVGVQQGSVFETYAKKFWVPAGVDIIPYPSADAVYADLVVGRLDATLDDATVVTESLLRKPEGQNFALIQPRVNDRDIFGPGTGIGLRKEDGALQASLNQAIAKIRSDGIYNKLAAKYFTFNIYGD